MALYHQTAFAILSLSLQHIARPTVGIFNFLPPLFGELTIRQDQLLNFMVSLPLTLVSSCLLLTLTTSFLLSAYSTSQQLDSSCGFTPHFAQFIKDRGYSLWNFDRQDIKCSSYGGKSTSSQSIRHNPVVFIHGNSDIGYGRGQIDGYASWQIGFRDAIAYLGTQGYSKAEMYTYTWGPAQILKASLQTHDRKYLLVARAFIEAVLQYTGAKEINVVSHSMGVTIARKVLKGGSAIDEEGTYQIGKSLKERVHTFVGIAGGNLGLTACWNQLVIPTCNGVNGFNPGSTPLSSPSKYLHQLEKDPSPQASNVYSVWSAFDEVIGGGCVVWGKVTCRMRTQQAQIVKDSPEWTHLALRNRIGPDIFKLL